jgi:hypothetical protein
MYRMGRGVFVPLNISGCLHMAYPLIYLVQSLIQALAMARISSLTLSALMVISPKILFVFV